jgi:hypothetical protein
MSSPRALYHFDECLCGFGPLEGVGTGAIPQPLPALRPRGAASKRRRPAGSRSEPCNLQEFI